MLTLAFVSAKCWLQSFVWFLRLNFSFSFKMVEIYFEIVSWNKINNLFSFSALGICVVTTNYKKFLYNQQKHKPRIVGGVHASLSYPFMVSLFFKSYFIGGGVIIENEWILTVAHLLQNVQNIDDIQIGYGSIRISSQKLVSIDQYVIHENFSKVKYQNDIALIKTNDPILINGRTEQIYLPYPEYREPIKNDSIRIIGWGDVKYKQNNINGTLKEANMKQTTESLCNKLYDKKIDQTQICLISTNNSQISGTCEVRSISFVQRLTQSFILRAILVVQQLNFSITNQW